MPDILQQIELALLVPDPTQPRSQFQPEVIERLAASISARGVLAPLRVRHDTERKQYLIICGENRYRAALQAGLKTVPCVVADGQPTEADLLDFYRELPNPDKAFVTLPGMAHTLVLGTNRELFWYASQAFLKQPKPLVMV